MFSLIIRTKRTVADQGLNYIEPPVRGQGAKGARILGIYTIDM